MGRQIATAEVLVALDFQVRHHRIFLNRRAIDRIIQSSLFVEAWNKASIFERRFLISYIDQLQVQKVRDWISKIVISTLDRCTTRMLREFASYHRIKNYGRMSKTQLLKALEKKGNINGS